MASSARSNDPEIRISVARMRPDSWRNTVSAAVFASKLIRFRKIVHGTNLDASFTTTADGRNSFAPFDCFVEVLAFQNIVAGQLFLRFREWSVRRQHLSIAQPHRCCSVRRLQGVSTLDCRGELLTKRPVFVQLRFLIPGAESFLVFVNQ